MQLTCLLKPNIKEIIWFIELRLRWNALLLILNQNVHITDSSNKLVAFTMGKYYIFPIVGNQ
jgi:hypothetical protein